jgi:hypothetical protein
MILFKKLSSFTVFLAIAFGSFAQNTVGLINYQPGNQEGYVLFSPIVSRNSYLIDKCGEKVHQWSASTYKPALSAYLLEDGSLLRTGQLNNLDFDEGGSGGIIERFSWNGELTWSYSISNSMNCQHHDILPMANGNILCIVWDSYTKQEAISKGKDSTYNLTHIWSEKIVELQPIGLDSAEVVWEWKLWNHLVQDYDMSKPDFGNISSNPGLVNINYFPGAGGSPDWIHLNSIDYNEELDQILLSSHTLNEIWIIDHSTTTDQAASHSGGNSGKGGDLLYRWGNPQAYQRGNPSTKKLYGQHHSTWIPQGYPNEGKLLVFNNGLNRPGNYSSIDIIAPPLNESNTYSIDASSQYLPLDLSWSYTANNPSDFYSSNISGVYPLENGSFMATSGTKGMFLEIDSSKQIQWTYINPENNSGIMTQGNTPSNNLVFRCNFYTEDYPAFTGQTLAPLGEIELNPTSPSICQTLSTSDEYPNLVSIYPNPVSSVLSINTENLSDFKIQITDVFGRIVLEEKNKSTVDCSSLSHGVYFISIISRNNQIVLFRTLAKS